MNDVKFRVEPHLLSLPSRKDVMPKLISWVAPAKIDCRKLHELTVPTHQRGSVRSYRYNPQELRQMTA
jgi:hypothetical protein